MTVDTITIPGSNTSFQIQQAGLHVTQESLYLLQFVSQMGNNFNNARVPGCGTGLLPIGLAMLFPSLNISAVEIQESLANTAVNNCKINNVSDRISIVTGDIRHKKIRSPDQNRDLIVMNPPFRKINTGKTSPNDLLRVSSHEYYGTLEDFIRIASIELAYKGVIALVMLPERLAELLAVMEKRQIPAFKIQMLHHYIDSSANAVLVAGRKNCQMTLTIAPPIFIESGIAE
jgi:tRNA1Val (adenine37-N6)-methyltransferase